MTDTLGFAHLVDNLPAGAELVGGPGDGETIPITPSWYLYDFAGRDAVYRADGSTSTDGRRKRLIFCPEVADGARA